MRFEIDNVDALWNSIVGEILVMTHKYPKWRSRYYAQHLSSGDSSASLWNFPKSLARWCVQNIPTWFSCVVARGARHISPKRVTRIIMPAAALNSSTSCRQLQGEIFRLGIKALVSHWNTITTALNFTEGWHQNIFGNNEAFCCKFYNITLFTQSP